MAKYFMSGTRLENLERLMMDPSRSEHSSAPDVCREKGRYQNATHDPLDNRLFEQSGGQDKGGLHRKR